MTYKCHSDQLQINVDIIVKSLSSAPFKNAEQEADKAGVTSSGMLKGEDGMWAATQFYIWSDFNMLTIMWWEHDDPNVRAYVFALLLISRKDEFNNFIKNRIKNANRFAEAERDMRIIEIEWAVKSKQLIVKALIDKGIYQEAAK